MRRVRRRPVPGAARAVPVLRAAAAQQPRRLHAAVQAAHGGPRRAARPARRRLRRSDPHTCVIQNALHYNK